VAALVHAVEGLKLLVQTTAPAQFWTWAAAQRERAFGIIVPTAALLPRKTTRTAFALFFTLMIL
jgi:hypothetical protein